MDEISQASESVEAVVETSTETQAQVTSQSEVVADVQAAPAYTPNFKYKVMDKEHEFDDFIKAAIKDADTEKKARELYERSRGLDEVKAKREKLNEEYTGYKKNTEPILNVYTTAAQKYQKAMTALKSGDTYGGTALLDDAFQTLGVTEDIILKHAYNKLNIKELPPQQQQQYSRMSEVEKQNYELQQQVQAFQSQNQNLSVQQRHLELMQTLQQPEINSIQSSYDQRNGQDSFKAAVWQYAGMIYNQTGQDLTPQEAVQQFTQRFGLQAQPQMQTQPAQNQPQQQAHNGGHVPVIPVVKGSGGSPSHRNFKSLKDLEAYAAEKLGS